MREANQSWSEGFLIKMEQSKSVIQDQSDIQVEEERISKHSAAIVQNKEVRMQISVRQRLIMSPIFPLGTDTCLRAWFGCHVTANTIVKETIMPSFIVNKDRLAKPFGGSGLETIRKVWV